MFNKKNLVKMSLFIGVLSVAFYMAYAFGLSWRGQPLITNVIDINITILSPIKTQILDFLGNDYGSLLYNIICLNLGWYIFVVFPCWVYHLIKGVLVYER